MLVYVFGDIYPVKYRTFKLLDIRIFRAYGFDQIVQILEDKPVCADNLPNLIHLATMRDQLIGGRHINAIDVGETNFRRGGRQINLLRAGFPGHLDDLL